MPKLKPTDLQRSRALVKAEIGYATERGMSNPQTVAKRIGMPESTYYRRLCEGESIRLSELWKLIKVLQLTDEQVLRIAKGG